MTPTYLELAYEGNYAFRIGNVEYFTYKGEVWAAYHKTEQVTPLTIQLFYD